MVVQDSSEESSEQLTTAPDTSDHVRTLQKVRIGQNSSDHFKPAENSSEQLSREQKSSGQLRAAQARKNGSEQLRTFQNNSEQLTAQHCPEELGTTFRTAQPRSLEKLRAAQQS